MSEADPMGDYSSPQPESAAMTSPTWDELDAIRKGKSDIDLAERIWRLERAAENTAPNLRKEKLQRYTFEKVGGGYQFTTTTDGLWVMAKDVDKLELELADMTADRDRCERLMVTASNALAQSATGATGWIATSKTGEVLHFSKTDGWTVEVVAVERTASGKGRE